MKFALTERQTQKLSEVVQSELEYMVYESDCPREYKKEIDAFIMLLKKLGEKEKAAEFLYGFKNR